MTDTTPTQTPEAPTSDYHSRFVALCQGMTAVEEAKAQYEDKRRNRLENLPARERIAYGLIVEANRLLVKARAMMLHTNNPFPEE